MMVVESKGKEIKACCRRRREKGRFRTKETNDGPESKGKEIKECLQKEKGEREFQKQMMVSERQEKEIKACCRGRREKGSFRNKCRSLKGRGK
jgi:hypothetical protein